MKKIFYIILVLVVVSCCIPFGNNDVNSDNPKVTVNKANVYENVVVIDEKT